VKLAKNIARKKIRDKVKKTDLSEFAFALLGFRAEKRHRGLSFTRLLAAVARAFHLPDLAARNLQKNREKDILFSLLCVELDLDRSLGD